MDWISDGETIEVDGASGRVRKDRLSEAEIASRASFDDIRYAQLWEDADVLVEALGDQRGATLVSICLGRRQCAGDADARSGAGRGDRPVGGADRLPQDPHRRVSDARPCRPRSN